MNAENDSLFIVDYIGQCWPEFSVTQDQIEHPTSEFVISFYEKFRENLNEILDWIMDKEPQDVSVLPKNDDDPIFSLLRFVNKYLLKVSDQADCTLTLTDLYVPTAKRTKIRFKLLVHLLVFYEEQTDNLKNVVVHRQEQAGEYKKKKTEKEQLKVELAKEAETLARSRDEMQKLQKELAKTELRYTNLQEQRDDIERKFKKMRHDLKVLVDTHQNKQKLVINIKTNIQNLNEQVIAEESIKSLQDLKENLVKKCEKLEAEANCTAANLESRKPTVERFHNIIKQIQTANCEELKALQNAIVQNKTEIKSYELEYVQKNSEIQKLSASKVKEKETTKSLNEATQCEERKHITMLDQVKQELEQVQAEITEEMSIQNGINNKKNKLQKEIANSREKCVGIKTEIERFDAYCGNAYKKILNDENVITNNFNEVLGSVVQEISKNSSTLKK